jgi:hypothetical protein
MATELKIFAPPVNQVLPIEGGRFLISTVVAPVDIYLPHDPHPGVAFKIYDASRNAVNNNITIRTLHGELINGAPTFVINSNGAMADIFHEHDTDNFIATSTGITPGGGGGSGVPSLKTYDTVNQMSQEPLYNQVSMFYCRGLNAPGDGLGGGFYIWDQTETAPADGNQYVLSVFTPIGRFVQVMS